METNQCVANIALLTISLYFETKAAWRSAIRTKNVFQRAKKNENWFDRNYKKWF